MKKIKVVLLNSLLACFFLVFLTGGVFAQSSNSTSISEWKMMGRTLEHSSYYPYNINMSGFDLLWKFTATGGTYGAGFWGSAVVSNGVVYAGSDNGYLYALNATNGNEIWNKSTAGVIENTPAIADGVVYFGNYEDKKFYALNATNGSEIWNYSDNKNFYLSSPVVYNGIVYISAGESKGKLYALNATNGSEIWNKSIGEWMDNGNSPTIANGKLYIADDLGNVYALNLLTGNKIWNYSIGEIIYNYPLVVNNEVYVGTQKGVYALNDSDNGSLIWSNSTNNVGGITVFNGVVYVSICESGTPNNFYAFNATNNGSLILNRTINSSVPGECINRAPAITKNGILFFGTGGNKLYAVDSTSLPNLIVKSYQLDSKVYSGVSIADGVVYVSDTSGNIYAFGIPPPDRDNDGIYNEVDTLPNNYSTGFSDGGTSGYIIYKPASMNVLIYDAVSPEEGVEVKISGPEKVKIRVCGITISFGAGTYILTCGSLIVDVIEGNAEIELGNETTITQTIFVDEGSKVWVNNKTESIVEIKAIQGSVTTNFVIDDVTQTIVISEGGNVSIEKTFDESGAITEANITLVENSSVGNVTVNDAPIDVGESVNLIASLIETIDAPIEPISVNTLINANADFSDLGASTIATAVWDWGDGLTSDGVISQENGIVSVSGSHAYANPGIYTITLTITDNNGNQGQSVFHYMVVYNPEGGFVTGGGWINSPEGAYTSNPSLSGKATFGFVSKYEKGAVIPTGQTEFQFKLANLNFHSTSYYWLVIAGSKAQYKGLGKINGIGEYGFMLTFIDGQINNGTGIDKFRIKIWDKGTEAIIYDNQLGAEDTAEPFTILGGGNIIIHKG